MPMLKQKSSESSESDEDDDGEKWACGTDAFTMYLSENQIELDCPHLKKNVNQCCIRHDNCYDDQLGRKHCDETFCSCLDVATKGSEVCNTENAPLFCGMVQQFGAEAYRRSGNHTDLNETIADELQEIANVTANITASHSSNDTDYDYESTVRVNDTLLENSQQDGLDLLESIVKLHQ